MTAPTPSPVDGHMPLQASPSEQFLNESPERTFHPEEDGIPDVLLIYPAGRSAVALLLADAITDAGYTVGREEVGNPQLVATILQQRNAKATLLIWSRELITAIGREDWMRRLRDRSLIEVSVDGIRPPGESVQVEFLSGWRGAIPPRLAGGPQKNRAVVRQSSEPPEGRGGDDPRPRPRVDRSRL